jgi:hypothetical protein
MEKLQNAGLRTRVRRSVGATPDIGPWPFALLGCPGPAVLASAGALR